MWRPRGVLSWLLALAALALAALAAAFAVYQLHPTEDTLLPGGLGALPLYTPWVILLLALAGAGLGWLAVRVGAWIAAVLFVAAAVAVAVVCLNPIVAVWLYARQQGAPVSLAASLRSAGNLDFGGAQPERAVRYATAPDGAELVLDVWPAGRSNGSALRPAVVKVHGGGWVNGERSQDIAWNPFFNALGYAVFDIDYRMPPPERWRDEVGDVKCALGWVAANAARYGVDPKRISLFGFSAGGHLAMLAAYTAGDPQFPPSCDVEVPPVKSVINLYGPADLVLLYETGGSPRYVRDSFDPYIGGPPSRYPERYRALSPLAHIDARSPPTITFLGRTDHVVPLDQAERLDAALERAGVAHETYLIPATDHTFDANRGALATQFARWKVAAFLKAHD